MILSIVLFQEQIFEFFVNNINWRILKIFGPMLDDSVKWPDDLYRLLIKSRKALAGIFSGLLGYLFFKGIKKKIKIKFSKVITKLCLMIYWLFVGNKWIWTCLITYFVNPGTTFASHHSGKCTKLFHIKNSG